MISVPDDVDDDDVTLSRTVTLYISARVLTLDRSYKLGKQPL